MDQTTFKSKIPLGNV